MTGCKVDDCDRPHRAIGLCNMHWQRQYHHGSLELSPGRRPGISRGKVPADEAALFWSHVDVGGECWEWTAFRNARGYGMFNAVQANGSRRPEIASRVSYRLTHGEIPPGHFVRHTCDNPPCVNPAHLVTGTHADNMRDMRERGRAATGSNHGRSRLTEEQVKQVKARISNNESNGSIARSLGVSSSTIDNIANGKTWKTIK